MKCPLHEYAKTMNEFIFVLTEALDQSYKNAEDKINKMLMQLSEYNIGVCIGCGKIIRTDAVHGKRTCFLCFCKSGRHLKIVVAQHVWNVKNELFSFAFRYNGQFIVCADGTHWVIGKRQMEWYNHYA